MEIHGGNWLHLAIRFYTEFLAARVISCCYDWPWNCDDKIIARRAVSVGDTYGNVRDAKSIHLCYRDIKGFCISINRKNANKR